MSLQPVRSVPEFYARAIAIEREAIACYNDFAGRMEALGNAETAQLFREIARQEEGHAQELVRCADGCRMPAISSASVPPPLSIAGDSAALIEASLSPIGAIQIAMSAERRAVSFYQNVSLTSPDPVVRELAESMILEEFEHLQLLERLAARLDAKPAH
ncbi:hypothetical protein GCM10025771_14290 [Niveibacterium umoris]|uniref:Rubrerythrin n=1 Tax=Niveibacterium umoris TaxID=1193620 RepID=A0A840BT47_9RHOO|nr:ferritin family protein [Niveibacterium umoris]MBB4014698.1 rubrerythrin [Niveibacterium umoris]